MTRINIQLDEDLHKQAKVACATDGKTLIEFVNEALLEQLEEDPQN